MLVRNKLKLAQLEVAARKAGTLGAGMFGASGIVALYGVGCLLACTIIAISGTVATRSPRFIHRRTALPRLSQGVAALLGEQRISSGSASAPRAGGREDVEADVEGMKRRRADERHRYPRPSPRRTLQQEIDEEPGASRADRRATQAAKAEREGQDHQAS